MIAGSALVVALAIVSAVTIVAMVWRDADVRRMRERAADRETAKLVREYTERLAAVERKSAELAERVAARDVARALKR